MARTYVGYSLRSTGVDLDQAVFPLPGILNLTAAVSRIRGGATSWGVQNASGLSDNVVVTDAGVMTIRAGLVVSAGSLTVPSIVTTGDVTVGGNLAITGTLSLASLTLSAGLTVTGGGITVSLGTTAVQALTATTLNMSSTLTMSAAASKLVPGGTSFSLRNNADSADNLIITDAGVATVRAGLAVSAGTSALQAITGTTLSLSGTLTMTSAASKLVPGVTSFSHRNNADSADNLIISDAGVATVRAGLTVTAGTTAVQALTGTTGNFSGLITGQNALTISSGTSALQALTATGAVIGTDPTGTGVTRTSSIRIGGSSRSGLISDDGTNVAFTKTGTGGYSFDAVISGTGLTLTAPTSTLLVAGRQGATNPALQVDSSAGLTVTGLKVTAAASGSGLALAVISSAGNENLTIDALGSGTITLAGTSTGLIAVNRSLTVGGASGTVASLGTIRLPNNNVIAWRNLGNSADFTLRLGTSNTFDFDTSITTPQGSKHSLNAGGTTYLIESSSVSHQVDIVSNSVISASFTGGNAQLAASGATLGFYGAAGILKPTIAGSRGGNAALASLLTNLASQGLVTDGTSA